MLGYFAPDYSLVCCLAERPDTQKKNKRAFVKRDRVMSRLSIGLKQK